MAALTGQQLRRDVLTILDRQPVQIVPDANFTGIVIEDPDLCPRYSAALIEGLKVGPSPLWMQLRLQRAGMRPINNVVDVTNYVMLELGQPLHAFDYDLLRERANGGRPTIIMRRARPGEHLTTLDGVDRALDPDMLMITDTAGTIAVGGVMGGADTEVHDPTETGLRTTTAVLLEAANFNFLSIRRTSQLLKLSSEAGNRFGKRVPASCWPLSPAAPRAPSTATSTRAGPTRAPSSLTPPTSTGCWAWRSRWTSRRGFWGRWSLE
jgi:phenylalanyl-tRNA synthetase beta chain